MLLNSCIEKSSHEEQPVEEVSGSAPPARAERPFVLRLRPKLPLEDVTRLIGYVCDFGTGTARGHALGEGWCLRMDSLADVELLRHQWPELVAGYSIDDEDVLWRSI